VHANIDGRVTDADVGYKLPGEAVFRTTTRPIHKLVMVLLVEEQAAANERGKKEITRPEESAPLPIMEQGPPREEDVEAGRVREGPLSDKPPEYIPCPVRKKQGKPKLAVKNKKVTLRKKAGEQARTVVVSVPKEKEEIMDLGVKQRKRGRPRKTPSTDPPDPRKGSVPDPGKGVCADPVNRGAILEGEGPGPPSRDKERQLSPDKGRAKTGKDEKMAGGQGRLPLHCFKARACTE
jgi:hypothetical protein